jgi:polyphosphate kinase
LKGIGSTLVANEQQSPKPAGPPTRPSHRNKGGSINSTAALVEISTNKTAEDQETSRFFNRELSWLAFNQRVLEEAVAPHHPLLERLNYMSIAASNLDEFFMKRIGGLQRQQAAGVTRLTNDGLSPTEQIASLRHHILEIIGSKSRLLEEELLPALESEGIHLASWDDLQQAEHNWLKKHFEMGILPVLTPLGVGPGQPFPFISNLCISLGVCVIAPGEKSPRFARVKSPPNLPRWIALPDNRTYIAQENVIAAHINRLFPGMEVLEASPFRVTRNADVDRLEEEADDLLETIEAELRSRRFAPIVRLECHDSISEELLNWLVVELEVNGDTDIYKSSAPLGMVDLKQFVRLDRPDLQNEPHSPVPHPALRSLDSNRGGGNIFDITRQGDILVHHPYQSFSTTVLEMLRSAAVDPQVLAIKQTLYRTASNSPIVSALLKAAENGKEVNVQVEIKARFDEANNIEWVRTLEKAGVHVTYGFIGLKTHSKILLVVRNEVDGIRRYAHIGTGNYHTGTARLYTDLGLLTCDADLCQDVSDLFNYLTGHSRFKNYKKLLVAPINMRTRFLEMIRREIENQRLYGNGRIVAKMNQLEDPKIIEALYDASGAGVQIELIVRGFVCLRPGVPGLSENIRVTSIIGRFLEHSRIYRFENNGKPEFYIGSADWMSRNLDARVEATSPIESTPLQKELDFILSTCLKDRAQSWSLQSDGSYVRCRPRRGKGSQNLFIGHYSKL